MLNNIRKFSKTIFAKIIIAIIIVPFVFWGMGSVFNSGNTNTIVKINNKSISAQDFLDHLRFSNISSEIIKANIDKEILEKFLNDLISKELVEMEIKKFNLMITEKTLAREIRKNKEFFDEDGFFSRSKYEKFLISQNLDAPSFEIILKERMLKNNLFNFIGGGVASPYFFSNNVYKDENKKIDVKLLNLSKLYKKKEDFTEDEIKNYIKNNKKSFQRELIDFSYAKITPQNLIGSDEFNDVFFEKIDEIENKIFNGDSFQNIIFDYKINFKDKIGFLPSDNENNKIENKIYQNKNSDKIQIIEEQDFFVLYSINKIYEADVNFENDEIKQKVLTQLFEKNKNDFNFELFKKISAKTFNDNELKSLSSKNNIEIQSLKIKSVTDDVFLNKESLELIYSMPENSFMLITDKERKVYVAKIEKISSQNLITQNDKIKEYENKSNFMIKDNIYSTYDILLNKDYKVKINQKTLERVKNYFK